MKWKFLKFDWREVRLKIIERAGKSVDYWVRQRDSWTLFFVKISLRSFNDVDKHSRKKFLQFIADAARFSKMYLIIRETEVHKFNHNLVVGLLNQSAISQFFSNSQMSPEKNAMIRKSLSHFPPQVSFSRFSPSSGSNRSKSPKSQENKLSKKLWLPQHK